MSRRIKRLIDIIGAIAGMIVLAPAVGVVALLIRVGLGRPVLFRQRRGGFQGTPFTMNKFRTMNDARDADGCPLPDHCRLTRLGSILRKTSLDELPQLWHVLKGEMSFIGPRPLPVEYLELYTREQFRRHSVPQGVVGWASVKGRNLNTWEKKFELDLWYVDHWSLWLDFKILVMALATVVRRAGVNEEGHATCSSFRGSGMSDAGRS